VNHRIDTRRPVVLRRPEPRDVDALYAWKNDPVIASLLGGFSTGYARSDIEAWIARHRDRQDEVVWTIADAGTDVCLGHVGLYRIDHRSRRAEFAILLGDRSAWGQGVGKRVTAFVVDYGFRHLNLHRVELSVLGTNERAIALYRSLGFRDEGVQRDAVWKDGRYVDNLLMAVLEGEWTEHVS
jgi:RimJ/RimL family protein N-acetyltransferase